LAAQCFLISAALIYQQFNLSELKYIKGIEDIQEGTMVNKFQCEYHSIC
jgi:hypothetical protein